MFAVVCVPNFALQSLLRHEPELRDRPVALIDAAGTNLARTLVLECTRAAEASDVSPGLTAPQAQARCRELILKPRSLSAEQSATEMLLQTVYAFSPNIENTAPGVCSIDLRGLSFGSSGDESTETKSEIRNPKSEAVSGIFASTAANDHTTQPSFDFFDDTAKATALGENNVSFPLTPALSPGERATANPSLDQSRDCERTTHLRAQNEYRTFLPLPEGEGRGEGEGRDASSNALLISWAATILRALHQVGLKAQAGVASTPNIALLAARAARSVLVVERASEFFDTLPFAALEPSPQVFDIVRRWGIHTAGAFLALGREAIAARLGAEALELFDRANTATIRPLTIVVPSDTFDERMDFEAHIETIEPLLFVLRRFVEQLAARISLTYRVIAELRLTLALESGMSYEHTLKVPAPTANVETLFRMLHTHLESLRTDSAIQSLHLMASPVRGEEQQFGLFESALRDPNHFHETLARLAALVGGERVGSPVAESTHRPDTFRMKTPDFGAEQIRNLKLETRNTAGLCLRRFRPPIHADVELKNGEPVFINTLMGSGRVKRARGPWCISGTWWDQRRWSRQEWDVETEKGEVYRVRNAEGDWVVEGVYD